jgi:hypothetical protein
MYRTVLGSEDGGLRSRLNGRSARSIVSGPASGWGTGHGCGIAADDKTTLFIDMQMLKPLLPRPPPFLPSAKMIRYSVLADIPKSAGVRINTTSKQAAAYSKIPNLSDLAPSVASSSLRST